MASAAQKAAPATTLGVGVVILAGWVYIGVLGFCNEQDKYYMGIMTENRCLRCRNDCAPLANISSDEGAESFVCVGYNRAEDRAVAQDRFTLCWKNDAVDERSHWDRRDLLDTLSVIGQALSTDENIRVGNNMTDEQMNDTELI